MKKKLKIWVLKIIATITMINKCFGLIVLIVAIQLVMFGENVQQIQASGGDPAGYSGGTEKSTDENSQRKIDTGFRVMDPDKQREIARKGGTARGEQMKEAAKDDT